MKPRVSVVVPTYGRPVLLSRCLEALAAQTLPRADFEVIVVSDGPDALTRAAIDRSGLPVRYRTLPRRSGPATARNAGWRVALAPIVAFTDDDSVPSPDWLRAGLVELDEGCDAVAGRVVMPISSKPSDYERDAARLADAEFVTVNCFVTVAMLEAVGGFDERFELAWREDSDLHFGLLAQGAAVGRAPSALVVHPLRPAPWGVSLTQQRKVVFDALLYKKHRGLYRQRIRRRPRFDYYAAVAALLVAVVAFAFDVTTVGIVAFAAWLALTLRLAVRRLAGTRHEWRHVGEMLVTSAAIPLLAVFWRIVGAVRYRVVLL
ncbi:MAG TPA: glycosyltransferase [Gammaproteobacteria bacterium]|nr:glycosyltransferase [Gammaproteobacteria bacterium]